MRDSIFYAGTSGFVAGIFLWSFVNVGTGFSGLLLLLGAVVFVLISLNKGSTAFLSRRDVTPLLSKTTVLPLLGEIPSVLKDSDTSLDREDTSLPSADRGTPLARGDFRFIFLFLAVFLLATGLGVLRYDFADRSGPKRALHQYLGQTVVLEGLVVDEPDERESVARLILEPLLPPSPPFQRGRIEEGVVSTAPPVPSLERRGGKVLLTVSREPRYEYGDRLRVEGKLEQPRNFTPTPTSASLRRVLTVETQADEQRENTVLHGEPISGNKNTMPKLVSGFKDETTLREVDYVSHLEKDGIYYEMFRPKITFIARGEGNPVIEKLFAFKHAFIMNVNQLIPQPHAALLAGLVVGAKQSLGKNLLDDFRTVGIIHIVVLSGYNITIIARFIEWLFSGLRRNARLIIAALAMILFALMVGASATVVRATIMALLVLLAHGTGRLYAVTRALLIAGVIMLLHNPKILVFDTSFQLSFLATVGLIYFSPLVEPRVKWITERWRMREITVATIATQLFVLPFLLYKTGMLSLVSLPVNLLVLIAIPATMLFGFLAGIAGFAASAFAAPFAFLSYALLAYELAVVDWFARLPFAAVTLASFPLWLVVLCYAGYSVLIWKMRQKSSSQLSPSLS